MATKLLKLTAILVAMLLAASARAEPPINSIGLIGAEAEKRFNGLRQAGMLYSRRVGDASSSFWMPSELELSAGLLERGGESAGYVSFGPSYRIPVGNADKDKWFIGFGVHPTYVSEASFEGNDLGGHFFFTSFLGLGAYLDRSGATSVMLRYQHTSNGGLDDTNPGVDMLGLTIRYGFGGVRDEIHADHSAGD